MMKILGKSMQHVSTILKNNLFKNTFILGTGTLTSQVITAISIPFLSRLYDTSAWGLYTLFISITGVLSVAIAWRYELAIMLPADDEAAANILGLSVCIVIGMASLIGLFIVVCGTYIASWLDESRLQVIFALLPLSALIVGINETTSYWATRRKYFKAIALSQVLSGSVPIFQLLLGALNVGNIGLIIGQIAGQLIALFSLSIVVWKTDSHFIIKALNVSKMKALGKRYFHFPRYNAFQALINAFSQNIPSFLLGLFFGLNVVGLYGMANRLLQMPLTLVNMATQKVLLQRLSELRHQQGSIRVFLKKVTFGLALSGVLPTLLVIGFGPLIFSLLLGEKWYISGQYGQWLSIWVYSSLIVIVSNISLYIFEKLRFLFFFDVSQILVRALGVIIGGYFGRPDLSIALFSLTGFAFNLFLISVAWYSAQKEVVV